MRLLHRTLLWWILAGPGGVDGSLVTSDAWNVDAAIKTAHSYGPLRPSYSSSIPDACCSDTLAAALPTFAHRLSTRVCASTAATFLEDSSSERITDGPAVKVSRKRQRHRTDGVVVAEPYSSVELAARFGTVSNASARGRRSGSLESTTTTTNRGGVLLGGCTAPALLPYSSAIKALRAYHSVHGDLVLPRRYVVPHDSNEYPVEWRGVDLASTVYEMKWWQRHIRSHPRRVAELNRLGFVWERLQPEWNLVLEALVTYATLTKNDVGGGGDVDDGLVVPVSFVVPHGDEAWPQATWGLRLGRCAHSIRSRNDFVAGRPDRVNQLNILGFVWDVGERAFNRTLRALKHFATLEQERDRHRHRRRGRKALRVPSNFVVPSGEHHGWPEDLWGFPLGAKCAAIRHKGLYVKNHPERLVLLEKLGFQWRHGNATLGWLEVVHAAAIYSQMHGRELCVPQNFVVPEPPRISRHDDGDCETAVTGSDDAWPWPEQLWGLPLGQRLKDVRLKGAYLTGKWATARRAQLDALGFVWKPKRGRRRVNRSVCLEQEGAFQ